MSKRALRRPDSPAARLGAMRQARQRFRAWALRPRDMEKPYDPVNDVERDRWEPYRSQQAVEGARL